MNDSTFSLTRRNLLLGSAAIGGSALVGSPSLLLAAGEAAAAAPATHALDELGKMLGGELILPTDASYDEARKVWNGMIDKHPLAIARCSGVADVIDVIKFARDKSLPVSVRGGGHNVAGKALRDGAITIDLGPMHGIRVDPSRKTGRAQGGSLWHAFDRETVAFGLATT
ncbi:MAG: FAD-dependent oxidoreductase, partial [Lysobacterales bacterium]